MISFANETPWKLFFFGNNGLHMRWTAAANRLQYAKWSREASPLNSEVIICEGPWTMERAFIFREIYAQMLAPKIVIFTGIISLPEQTVLEGILDRVDIFLPEGVEQFWRADTQEILASALKNLLASSQAKMEMHS